MASAPTTASLLGVMQQLKDSQDRAKRAELRVHQLEMENERLQQDLRRAQMERISTAVGAYASNDELIIELQTQLAAAVNRNTQLELQMHGVNVSRTASMLGVASSGAVVPALSDAASPNRKHLL